MSLYKTITIRLADEDQVYVVESHVTGQDIIGGNDEGVVCLMVMVDKADALVNLLNSVRGDGVA